MGFGLFAEGDELLSDIAAFDSAGCAVAEELESKRDERGVFTAENGFALESWTKGKGFSPFELFDLCNRAFNR